MTVSPPRPPRPPRNGTGRPAPAGGRRGAAPDDPRHAAPPVDPRQLPPADPWQALGIDPDALHGTPAGRPESAGIPVPARSAPPADPAVPDRFGGLAEPDVDHRADTAAPARFARAAEPAEPDDDSRAGPTPFAAPFALRPLTELAARLDADDVVDAVDVIAELDVDDRAARDRYGMTSAESLGGSVLGLLRHRRGRGSRRAPARHAYLTAALLRCTLYLGPLSVAVAGVRSLREVAWPVPALVLLLGWSAAQALTSVGVSVLRRGGRPAAARLIGGGFVAVAGAWGGYVWVAPAAWLGPDRWLALTVGLGGIAVLATVTAALVTRTEAAVIRWSLPCWLLGAISIAATLGDGWATRVPVATLLPAAVTVAVIRAYRPVIGRRLPRRPRLDRADVRRAFGFLVIGAAQAACVAMLWRSGQPGATSPAALPLLAAVPVLEALVCWHTRQVERGLDAAETKRELRRHVRGVTLVTVAGLLPPLAAGGALAAAAYRLPYGLSATDRARDVVLALAAGTLLGGVFAGTFLLAARRRTAIAATLAALPPLAIAALPLLPGPAPDRLPAFVTVLAVTHLVGLVAVALTAADSRRSS